MVFSGGACIGYDEIRSMSGRYASYWNAFLFTDVLYGDVVLIFTVMLLASVRLVCRTSYTIIPKPATFKPNREFSAPINVIHVTFLMAA